VATEPATFMLSRARKRAVELGLDVEFHDAPAEALPFADASFDTVVATLVLCTVSEQTEPLSEVRRVLKPAGEFRFIEHVRADGGVHARVQDLITLAWSFVGAGCQPNRRTREAVGSAGFDFKRLERRWRPITPFIFGVAVPAGSDAISGDR